MGRPYTARYAEATTTENDPCYEQDDFGFEDETEVYQGERLAIGDSGPGGKRCWPYTAGSQSQKPAASISTTSKTANHHERLDLQMSLWPTFQRVGVPNAGDDARRPTKKEWLGPPDRGRDNVRDEGDYDVAMLEQDVHEYHFYNMLARVENQGQWRLAWHDVIQTGEYSAPHDTQNNGERPSRSKNTKKTVDSPRQLPPKVLRLPPTPAPLPPCLQCALAGACCSLTTTPYAQAFVNDRASSRRPRQSRIAITATPSWEVAYANLTKEVERSCPDWDSYTAELPWRRQQLEQHMLRLAIVRGDTDSPFLPQPPPQCTRCVRMGEAGCLQQSRDVSNTAAAMAGQETAVAWFASNGPPPRSLLPQHSVSLLDQIRYGPGHQYEEPRSSRLRAQKAPWPVLEAIFCRDPNALTAAGVAAKAQDLLEQIGKKYTRGASTGSRFSQRRRGNGSQDTPNYLKCLRQTTNKTVLDTHVRPATTLEVSRLLPRRSWLNVYANRGVATLKALAITVEKVGDAHERKTTFNQNDYRSTPPALPAWHANNKTSTVIDEGQQWLDEDVSTKPSVTHDYKWGEYFLDLGEDRVAAQLQTRKQKVERKERSKPLPIPPSPPPHPAKPLREQAAAVDSSSESKPETKEQRQVRIAKLAVALSDRVRAEQQRILGDADPARRIKVAPIGSGYAHPKRSLNDEIMIDDLIKRLSRSYDLKTSRRMATLAVGPGKK